MRLLKTFIFAIVIGFVALNISFFFQTRGSDNLLQSGWPLHFAYHNGSSSGSLTFAPFFDLDRIGWWWSPYIIDWTIYTIIALIVVVVKGKPLR